jgi:beta-lactam-binding protein with PASTA domain
VFASALVSLVLASATIAFAATNSPVSVPAAKPVTREKPNPLRVPAVTGEAYVFAKGILEDAGFAWNVRGAEGFAVNTVTAQSPAAGTLVADTGAPTIGLTLSRNSGYRELGTPENAAPYPGTEIVVLGGAPAPSKTFKRRSAPSLPSGK